MKIVILDGETANPGDLSWSGFEALGDLTVYPRTDFSEGNAEIIRRAKGATALLVNKTPLSGDTIRALLPELKYIGILATGYNTVDLETAKKFNIPVCNAPSYATGAVAQFVMALLLELCHHVGLHNASVKAGEWSRQKDFSYHKTPLIELSCKTIGLIGYGHIGQATALLAETFGMNVLAYDRYTQGDGRAYMVSLDELLEESDVVSLHCPLTAETEKIINAETIAKMKDGAFLINTARGALVDEEALAAALLSGKLAGAGLDVLQNEPPEADHPLMHIDNCIITPHIAWAPYDSRRRLLEIAQDNIEAWMEGVSKNVVNA